MSPRRAGGTDFGGLDLVVAWLSRGRGFVGLISFVSNPLQEGQTKMSVSRRAPSFGIVRRYFMVSPQERHTKVGVLPGTGDERSMVGVEGV